MGKYIFYGLCILIVAFELVFIVLILHRRSEKPFALRFIPPLACSVLIVICYTISVNTSNYFILSLFRSLYFCLIDVLLLLMLDIIIIVTKFKMHSFQTVTRWMARIYTIFDCIVLLINPFKEIVVHYTQDPDNVEHLIYIPNVLYYLHLALCYIVTVMLIYCIILKMVVVPAFYRRRYILILISIGLIIFLNTIIYHFSDQIGIDYDISELLYGAMCVLIYYNTFYFSEKEVIKAAPRQMLENMNYSVMLFDYENRFVTSSRVTKEFLQKDPESFTKDEFVKWMHIEDKIPENKEKTSFQLVYDQKLYRCDYQTLKHKKSLLGYVFSFTEVSTEYDMLTGFHTSAAAIRDFADASPVFPAGIMVCDINRLSNINEMHGHAAGDKAISSVADVMKKDCPEGTYFVRMHDALLMAACDGTTVSEMKQICTQITENVGEVSVGGEPLVVVCAFSMCTNAQPEVIKAIDIAEETIRVKKMMDSNSAHSSLLFSLARVLQEADPGTEQHVNRTRIMGEKLAERLELDDEDTANLSLLCLLHDVGKLCIPLEILNKPGKLTKPEWEMLKTHTQKGYQIAKASRELSPLADMILHHHEFWDGTGYPGGLSKEEIPLLSRIISIVDAYDAMTNDRPYRKAVSSRAALLEIERCSGTQFDPYIANIFCEMIREINGSADETNDGEELVADKSVPINVHSDLDVEKTPDELDKNDQLAPISFSRYILDKDGDHIVYADKNFENLTGYTEEDVAAGLVAQSMLIYPEDSKKYEELKNKLLQRDKEAFIEHRLRMKDGVCRNVYCHGWSFYDTSRKELSTQIIITDLTESVTLKKMLDNEREIAQHNQSIWKENLRHDVLTGLLNRIAFGNDLQEVLNSNEKISVMLMCDVDFFKQFNDSKGHGQGDELLKNLAHIMTEHVKDKGLVCRMGGDEFAIALFFRKNTDPEKIKEEAKSLWSGIDKDLSQFDTELSISMGMTISVGKEKNFAQMYDESDKALYQAKNNGKRQLAFYGKAEK